MKKDSPTKIALEMIKYDFAKNGKDTGIAMDYYTNHRISYAKFKEMANEGLKVFNQNK